MAEAKATKFSELYNLTEADKKKGDESITERAVKRHLKEKFDSALTKKLEAEMAIEKVRQDIANYDFNRVGQQKLTLRNLEEQMADIKAEYLYLFGVELKIEE